MEPSLADVLLCTLESTNTGFSSFLCGNLSESNSSSPTAFSHKRNPASEYK
jgi:hypothetical protein